MEEVSCLDRFSEGQLLGLELAIEIRAIVLRVSDRHHARRRCQAGRCMFAIDPPHRFASAPGQLTTVMTTSNIISRSPRKEDFQSASAEGLRIGRKNHLRIKKALASIA